MDYTELKLREEVEFWRNLIADWDEQQSREIRRRMRETLQYAEQKLERYLRSQKGELEQDSPL